MKNLFLFITLALLACVIISCKRDPFAANYDIEAFSLKDFNDHKELAKFLEPHFPPGTPRKYIEHILIDVGKMQKTAEVPWDVYKDASGLGHGNKYKDILKSFKSDHKVVYRAAGSSNIVSWMVAAHYDEKDNLLLMDAYGNLISKKE
ncbi:MAG: hypothetical protein DI586_08695 [Micavibrio aeruginosavorus]|uniref:Lipoprotein n=1 Tax=Micavibrio aeruginosavorus TaxID=349221 RepID=A0A2W5FHT1_9BACT|nr:MAG: hypothetical protein DI586_08695 [Micavibrio aeruginosavorus]